MERERESLREKGERLEPSVDDRGGDLGARKGAFGKQRRR